MGRTKKRKLIYPAAVCRMAAFITLLLDYHAAGFAVLSGAEALPTAEELAKMFSRSNGGSDLGMKVQGNNRISDPERYALQNADAEEWLKFVNGYKLVEAVRLFKEQRPSPASILAAIGMHGYALSIDRVAQEKHLSARTLNKIKEQAILELAFYIVYFDCPIFFK